MNKTKMKKIINKSELSEIDYINFLLEAAASSARFGVIKEKEKNNKWYVTRANIHVMLVMPFGSGKTSSFLDVDNAVYNYDVSFPGVIGTINKDGDVVESSVIKAGGKVLIIDEFQKLDDDVKNALNSILEYPHVYSRTLGFKVRNSVHKRGKYFYIKAKANDNRFEVFSKFSTIAGGMYFNRSTTIAKAWFSRFIPIRFTPSIEYYEKLSRGEKVIKINPIIKEMNFIFPKYLEFNRIYWDKVKSHPLFLYFKRYPNERGYLVRLLQDLVRISAFVASLEDRKTIRMEDTQFAMRLFDAILASYIYSDLDEVDVFILNNVASYKQKEIAEMFGLSEQAISEKIRRLRRRGLIK